MSSSPWKIVRVTCVHVLHPEPQQPWILPVWPFHPDPEARRICRTCRQRDARRLARAQRDAAAVRRWVRTPQHRLAPRFGSLTAQTQRANRVAPVGYAWCSWWSHYVQYTDLGSKLSQQAPTLCR